MEAFEQAAMANQWTPYRCVEIAPGYFKEAARDWYLSHKTELTHWLNWEEPGQNDGNSRIPHDRFKTKFFTFFTPETKQNQWYHELMTIRQFANEKVDDYSRRFKKLLRKVNF